MPTYKVTWIVTLIIDAQDEPEALGELIVRALQGELLPDVIDVTIKEVK